jgi:hypothetical protein
LKFYNKIPGLLFTVQKGGAKKLLPLRATAPAKFKDYLKISRIVTSFRFDDIAVSVESVDVGRPEEGKEH